MHHLGKKKSLQVAFSRGTVTSLWWTLPLRAAGPRYRFLKSTFHSEERNSRRKKKRFNFAMSAAESEMVVFFPPRKTFFFPTVELWRVAKRWPAWTDEWNLKPNQLPSWEPVKHQAREKRLRDLVTDVTVSLTNGISVDAAVAAVLSELDSVFTFKEGFSWWGTRINDRCCTLHCHRSMLKHFYCCLTWWMNRIQAETHWSVVPGWTFLASGFLCTYLQLNGRYWLLRR